MKTFQFNRRHKNVLLGALAVFAVIALFCLLAKGGIGIPCPFYQLTGLECPGCGNSRAALALLQLDIPAAFRYNPIFLPEFFYIGWVVIFSCRSYLKGKGFSYKSPVPWLDISILSAVVIWWILRNLL